MIQQAPIALLRADDRIMRAGDETILRNPRNHPETESA